MENEPVPVINQIYCMPAGSGVALVEWRGRRWRETGGVGGLLLWASAVCCWCGGKRLSCRGENHSKRELPRDGKEVLEKSQLVK